MQTQRAVASTGPSSRSPRPPRPGFRTRALASKVRTSAGSLASLTDLVKIAPLLLFGLIALGLIGVTLLAVVERLLSPTAQVIVRPFQISADLAKQLTTTGDAVSEMVSDDATTITVEGAQFHGLNPGSSGKHFGRLPLTVQIPVKTSIPFAIKGIPIDDLVQVYDRIRYDQIMISGDLYADRGVVQLRMRAEGGKLDGVPVITSIDPAQPVADALKQATIRLMTRVNPALVGRMYLFERDTPDAVTTFKEWANSDPLNPEPTFFLAYTYEVDNDEVQKLKLTTAEALLDSRVMAEWSLRVASYRNVCSGLIGSVRCGFERLRFSLRRSSPRAADQARASLAAVAEDTGDSLVAAKQYQDAAAQFDSAAENYRHLKGIYPEDTNLRINLALAELNEGNAANRAELLQHAIAEFRAAERLAPDNPLVEQDLGKALSDTAKIPEAIAHEESALLLAPFYFPSFANAVGMQWNNESYPAAATLCRSVYLLDRRRKPDGSAAAVTLPEELNTKQQCAYALALAGSVQRSLNLLAETGLERAAAEPSLRSWTAKQGPAATQRMGANLDAFDRISPVSK